MVVAATAGAALRVYQLPQQIVADDEWHAIHKLLESDYGGILKSFGANDHSIPLTLLYKVASDTIGLSELVMRVPVLLTGIALVSIFPLAVFPMVGRRTSEVFAWLVALSPLLIHFARTARPYGLTVALVPLALWTAWRWWRGNRVADAVLCALLIAASGYLHLASLPLAIAPIPILAALALVEPGGTRRMALKKVVILCAVTAPPLLLLLGPPLYADWASLTAKSRTDSVNVESVRTALELFSGTANPWIIASIILLACAGAVRLFRSRPRLTTYLLGCVALQVVFTVASGAAWLSHGAVLARYLLGILPVFLLLLAHGLTGLAELLPRRPRLLCPATLYGALLLLLAVGPLGEIFSYPNAFTGHAAFYFSFDPARNPYVSGLRPDRVPRFYSRLGEAATGSLTIAEAPWRYEWHYDRLPFFQRVHGQRVLIGFVNGLCSGPRFGEIPLGRSGFAFANFVQLADEDDVRRKGVDYVIFHRERWDERDDAVNVDECIERFHDRYGEPVYSGRHITAFAVGDAARIRARKR